jgi:hypothetical protein
MTDMAGRTVRTGENVAINNERTADTGSHANEQYRPGPERSTPTGLSERVGVHVVYHRGPAPGRGRQFASQVGTGPAGQHVGRAENQATCGVYDAGATDSKRTTRTQAYFKTVH